MDRHTALARSVARAFTVEHLEALGEGTSAEYDVEAIVTELIDSGDNDFQTMSGADFEALVTRHEAVEPSDEDIFA